MYTERPKSKSLRIRHHYSISFNLELPYTKACIDPCSASWSLGGEEVQELQYILVVARVRVHQSCINKLSHERD